MFKKEMKSLIIYAVSKDISGLETKEGYNGAPILRISSPDLNVVLDLQKWCNNLGYDNKILSNQLNNTPKILQEELIYSLFCVFGDDKVVDDIYRLL